MPSDSSITVATEADLAYIVDQQRKHKVELGFLPYKALLEYIHRRHVWVAHENGDNCGYLAWGGFNGRRPKRQPDTLKIAQACIQYDAQRRHNGEALVTKLIQFARSNQYSSISLWCASDLDANAFWRSMGFEHVGDRIGGSWHIQNRPHLRWRIDLGCGQLHLPFFDDNQPR